MLGATLALGVGEALRRGVVQGEGSALRMSVAQLQRALRDSPALRRMIHRYLYVQIAQLLRTNVCTHYHEIRPRLARWLLMTHDRANADHFHVTHELLASMLGVRRSGVTVAAGDLQHCQLIQYSRGNVSILDRAGLEASACDCYEAMLHDYARHMG
jgi:CRP-like cAMP-binding protein